jgi:hypothetical protein
MYILTAPLEGVKIFETRLYEEDFHFREDKKSPSPKLGSYEGYSNNTNISAPVWFSEKESMD